MKRTITAALAALLLLSGCGKGGSDSVSVADNIEGVRSFYDSVTDDQQWQNDLNTESRIDKLKLPESTLKGLSTEDLVDSILDYPLFFEWKRFSTCEAGLEYLNETLDTMQELKNRSDAASVLLKKYTDQKVYTDDEDAGSMTEALRIKDIELLITQDYILEQMTEEEKTKFYEVAKQKQKEKAASAMYDSPEEMIPDVLENLE